MENKLDVLTKKLYDEGVNKAKQEAATIIANAQKEAERLIAEAELKAKSIESKANDAVENLRKKAESEMMLSARQAVTALKQEITELVSGKVAGEMAKSGLEEKAFVQELLMSVVKKWDVSSGNINLEILLSESEKKQFEAYLTEKYKDLLDKGLTVKSGSGKEAFVLQPHDGSYKIAFSEALFESFFHQYVRGLTKELLYK
ncbi:V-type ATP synthase subunit E [Odoribacter sp. OttesenSCG-928-A06]|nr:V-type ATP synthase subunit E [Odoribacter sp. OttesenSCG-928-A06]